MEWRRWVWMCAAAVVMVVGGCGVAVVDGQTSGRTIESVFLDINATLPTLRLPPTGPEYPQDTDYYVTITAPPEAPWVVLNFTMLLTECGWDLTYVRDGGDLLAPIVAAAAQNSGPSPLPLIVSTGPQLHVHFHSDPFVLNIGVRASATFSPCPRACNLRGTCVPPSGNATAHSCACPPPYYGSACELVNTTSSAVPAFALAPCATSSLCKCPSDFRTNHETFLSRVGTGSLKWMVDTERVCAPPAVLDTVPVCAACTVPPPPESAASAEAEAWTGVGVRESGWRTFVVEACGCVAECINGTCNLDTQSCVCNPGYVGVRCDILASSLSTSGTPPNDPSFRQSSTISNVFVLVVLTLLVFIVVISIMLCKQRGQPGPVPPRSRADRINLNLPVFTILLDAPPVDPSSDPPFPIVIDLPPPDPSDPPIPVAHYVLRFPAPSDAHNDLSTLSVASVLATPLAYPELAPSPDAPTPTPAPHPSDTSDDPDDLVDAPNR